VALVIFLAVVLGLRLLLVPLLPGPSVLPALLLSLLPRLVSRLPALVPFAGEAELVGCQCSGGVGFALVS
jgi:hypothetical protein